MIKQMTAKFERRFDELLMRADEIASKKVPRDNIYGGRGFSIDSTDLIGWQTNCLQLLDSVCGQGSRQISKFNEQGTANKNNTTYGKLIHQKAIIAATKDDFDGGYLNSVRNLIHADVFDTELEQADELLQTGYLVAAAVVTGVVLETTLRQMCRESGIEAGKLDKMNADLAKEKIYDKLVQKQITLWADIRNKAAHGASDPLKKDDVDDMLRGVRRFITDRLSRPASA